MLAMLAKLFWPSLLSLTKLPAKDWGPSLLFLLDLCINSTLCRHNIALSEGSLCKTVAGKAASKQPRPSLLFWLDLCVNSTLCRHSTAMSEGCSRENVTGRAAPKGLGLQPAVLAGSLHQQDPLQTQHSHTRRLFT